MSFFGLTVAVSGEAWEGEQATMTNPHSEPEFEIGAVEHHNATFELEDLSDIAIQKIERAAIKSMKEVK